MPEAGLYKFVIEVDAGAEVSLAIDKEDCPLTLNGANRNTDPQKLEAGRLYELALQVKKVKDTLKIRWETPSRPKKWFPPAIFTRLPNSCHLVMLTLVF